MRSQLAHRRRPATLIWSHPWSAVAAPAALYVAFGALGYGNDGDTYAMLATWRSLFETHVYAMSRPPGYPVPEVIIGLASHLGGYFLANAVTVAFALLTLACFFWLIRPLFGGGLSGGLVLWVGTNPYWVIAASSSMDYMYSLGFALLGICLLSRRRPHLASALFVLSAASRLTIAPVLGLALLLHGLRDRQWRPAVVSTALFISGTLACYLPSWQTAGYDMFTVMNGGRFAPFFRADAGDFGLGGLIARAAHKNLALVGVVPLAALATILFRARRRFSIGTARPVMAGALLAWVYFQLLFLRLPHEPAYLLPTLPLVALAVGFFRPSNRAVGLLVALSLLNGLLTVNLVQPEYAVRTREQVQARSGRVAPHLAAGVLVEDARERRSTQEHFLRERGIRDGNSLLGVRADVRRPRP